MIESTGILSGGKITHAKDNRKRGKIGCLPVYVYQKGGLKGNNLEDLFFFTI